MVGIRGCFVVVIGKNGGEVFQSVDFGFAKSSVKRTVGVLESFCDVFGCSCDDVVGRSGGRAVLVGNHVTLGHVCIARVSHIQHLKHR